MSAQEQGPGWGRNAAAAALSLALLAAGVGLAWVAGPPAHATGIPLPLLLAVLLPIYVAAHHHSLDFEIRRESSSVTMVQLPLALGVQVIAPVAHLAVRVAAALTSIVIERQAPQKALYNVAAASFEVGAAAFAVGLVDHQTPGPDVWLALYLGLVIGDVVGAFVLTGVWRALGMPSDGRRTSRTLIRTAPASMLFTGLAVVAISAVRVEPLTGLVMLMLAAGLAYAYRGHRRLVAQQSVTESLYDFVRDLGPLTFHGPETPALLEQIRVMLHAEQLELAVPDGGVWRELRVTEGPTVACRSYSGSATDEDLPHVQAPTLRSRQRGTSDTMSSPLLGSRGLVGILRATERLGNVRGFEMGDLRLLETIGAEVSTALERGQLQEELERAATTDSLTELPNLSEATRQLSLLLRSCTTGVVLAAVAVDSFREVNDTLGHQVGDELLLEVARRLRLCNDAGVLGRIGGGRFLVAAPLHEVGGDAALFGLGLRDQAEGTAQIGPVGTHIRLSVGLVSSPEHGDDAATLIRRAETAMYSARRAHGGPVVWEPAYEVEGQRRLAVVMALREALSTGAIGVAFQPKVDAVSGRVSGVEALARWTHPALGSIAPDEFIPLAEASGLMGPLTSSVLRQSLTACRGWQRRAGRVGVAVNVSADTVLDQAFITEVASLLEATGVAADLLTLELTEGVVVSDPALAAVRLQELRSLGVKISVDDFGTGYSSLTYLKGLPVDEVKIDKGFVLGLSDDPADRAVVRAVVDIAHTLGLRVVAEGVENESQQGILRALGVDELQGYLHARPMPALEAAAWLRTRDGARQV